MKVTHDLRCAINAASRMSGRKRSWEQKRDDERAAIAALDKKKRGRISRLRNDLAILEDRVAKTREDLRSMGVGSDSSGPYICSDETFAEAGGINPAPDQRSWKADEVIVKLGAAKSEKEFNAILAEYGINWN